MAVEEKIGAEKAAEFQKALLEHADTGRQRFDEYFGGISEFKEIMPDLAELTDVIRVAETEIKNKGLNNQSAAVFKEQSEKMNLSSELSKELVQGIIQHLETEGGNIPEGQTRPGTSDIIESVFGKYKLFASKVKLQGISKLILTIPAFTADMSQERIKEAFETVRSIDVRQWLDDNLGMSILAKRKQAFN